MSVTPDDVGQFVDRVAGQVDVPRRTVTTVAGRFLEEAVELCLAAGLDPTQIMGHVMDSIHNQCAKRGRAAAAEGKYPVVYPSQYGATVDMKELGEELADCSLVMKDIVFLSGINLEAEETTKWSAFTQRRFHVSEKGTLYAIK
jgi:NTP pyrophosphatase (non-canonical NTP hydrolase)